MVFFLKKIKELSKLESSFGFMKHSIIIATIILLLPSLLYSQSKKNLKKLYKHVVVTLASNDMNGRLAGTEDEVKAGIFVKEVWQNMLFLPQKHSFTYQINDTGSALTSSNIYCYKDNHADSTILITAHFDHLGLGGTSHSRSYGKSGIHPGADDNASGVALMMGLAKTYKRWNNNHYNYLFVGYAAHEVGLYGSAAFHKYANTNFKPICLALNFDMVGRLDQQEQTISIFTFPSLHKDGLLLRSSGFDGRIYSDEPEKIFMTDCKSFAESGINCLSLTTGLHSDYHKISDMEALINYQGIYQVQLLAEYILKYYPNGNFSYN
jgi:hypothetical protein